MSSHTVGKPGLACNFHTLHRAGKHPWLWAVGGAFAATALLGLGGCGQSLDAREAGPVPKQPPAYPVRVAPVGRQAVEYVVQAIGRVEAQDVYRIEARVAGTVEELTFNEGDRSTPGQVLCQISPEVYRLKADRAEAAHTQALAEIASFRQKAAHAAARARLELAEAERKIERRRSVKVPGAISDEELQNFESLRKLAALELKATEENTQTQLKVLEAAAAEKQAALSIARDEWRKSVVYAPVPGLIDQRLVSPGAHVSPGTPLATIVDRSTMKVAFKVAEKDAAAVQPGSQVSFSVPAWPGRLFQAVVYHVSDQLQADTRVVACWAKIKAESERLKPGYFAAVKVHTGGERSLVVPSTALLPTERGFAAYIVEAGLAQRRQVKVGLSLVGDVQEVLSGLNEGEQVVIEGANALQQGVRVRVLGQRQLPLSGG